MAITEESRHAMVDALTEALGKEAAMTLVEHLPPVGWADVATRTDLEQLEERMTLRFDARLAEQTRSIYVAFVTTMLVFAGVLIAALNLTGP